VQAQGPDQASEVKSDAFYRWDEDVLVPNMPGTPGAWKDAMGKPKDHPLKVSVTATPRLGKATDHRVRFRAAEFGVAPSAIDMVFGRQNVEKQLRIKAPASLPTGINPPSATPAVGVVTPSAPPHNGPTLRAGQARRNAQRR
jgi:uncharacterized protein YggU (UPF0235/DUF167 family)